MKTNLSKFEVFILLIFILLQVSCDPQNELKLPPFSADSCELTSPTPESLRFKAVYDMPTINLADNHIFYSSERMDIKWTLPGDLWNTELQTIETSMPYKCDDYYKFHELNNNAFGYGNQFIHYYSSPQSLSLRDTIYVSYRARTTNVQIEKNYSLWTEVKSFMIVPIHFLNKRTVSETYNLQFLTEEVNHHYYSGVTTLPDYKLLDIATANDIDFDKIRIVNIVGFEITYKTFGEEGQNPFERIMIGYDENVNPNETVYPFDVIGDAYPGSYEESPMPGNLYSNLENNLTSVMKNYDLKIAYHLQGLAGYQEEIDINLVYDIYFEE